MKNVEHLIEDVTSYRSTGLTLREAIDKTTSDVEERSELAKIFSKEMKAEWTE